jgi:hypothetical protein
MADKFIARPGTRGRVSRPEDIRFWEKVEIGGGPEGECWIWTGMLMSGGTYGFFTVGSSANGTKRKVSAHRWAYQYLIGPIPEDRPDLDHSVCHVKQCVNPWHVTPRTNSEHAHQEDSMAGILAAKTHCPHGHPYSEENTRVRIRVRANRISRDRECWQCHRARGG